MYAFALIVAGVAGCLGIMLTLKNHNWSEQQIDILAFSIVVVIFSLVLNGCVWCAIRCSRRKEPGFYYYRARTAAGVPIGAPLTRGSLKAAGVDIQSGEDMMVLPQAMRVVKTNIHVSIPTGYYLQISPRSGFTVNNSAMIGAGVIDEDYRGLISVVVFNLSTSQPIRIEAGTRIAQGILHKISTTTPREVYDLDALGATARGERGFGSSGLK
jgi:dUTP pyrophosphatase